MAGLYVVSYGTVKLLRVDREGRQVTLRIITFPEAFGAVAILTGRTSYSAQALTETEALMLDNATFLEVMASHPQVVQRVSRLLATWVGESWERLDDLSVRRHVGLPPMTALAQEDAIRGIAEAASMSESVADILHRSGKTARLRTKGIPS